MTARQRIDIALVERGFFDSREKARGAIMAGVVKADSALVLKPGFQVDSETVFEVEQPLGYVSRGGLKLQGALTEFAIDVTGLDVIDVGASTGGFTDCMLQSGAASVTAVDVGYGQLAWKLRSDHRVRVIERTNIRHVQPGAIGDPFDLALIDVSFISLAHVFGPVASLLGPAGQLLALVKPQFEVGKGRVGKKGVVRERVLHIEVLDGVTAAAKHQGLRIMGICGSPIKGPEGNIEYWLWATVDQGREDAIINIEDIVVRTHDKLGV